MAPWESILGTSWLTDAAKSITKAMNSQIDGIASSLLESILDGVLQGIDFGNVNCDIYDGYVTPEPPPPSPSPPPPRPPPPPPSPPKPPSPPPKPRPPKYCVTDPC